MKDWFRRHQTTTWAIVFMPVASVDLPFYLAFPFLYQTWTYYPMKIGSLILGWLVADHVRSKL